MRLTRVGIVALAAILGGAVLGAPASAQAGTSAVYVVHGIPGQPVDVYVNGDRTLSDFQPKDVAGPLQLPAGEYDIALTKPGDDPGNALLEVQDVAVPAGQNLSLVAHLSADGDPALTPFVNDVSTLKAGQGRLIVRHTAAAPEVDVRANGEPVFEGLSNPNEAKADLPAGTVSADVVLAGTDDVVIGPADVNVAEGSVTIVYAIGSADQDTLDLVVQVIKGANGAPGGVPAGSGGLADTSLPAWWYAMLAASLLVLAAGVVAIVRRGSWSARR